MAYIDDYYDYSRMTVDNATLRLLRSEHAPLTMAFLKNLFAEVSEADYVDARERLTEFLGELAEKRPEINWQGATYYFRQWIDAGWIRELDNQLSMTDAAQKALDFCRVLGRRIVSTSATHLQILQNEVQSLFIHVTGSKRARIDELKRQKKLLDEEIRSIREGTDVALTDTEQKEKIRAVYDLACRLPADFRLLEEECRRDDQELRSCMAQSRMTKGEMLRRLLDAETEHRKSEYGAAYEGFYRLISDKDLRDGFTSRIRGILAQPIAGFLEPQERRFLVNLVDRLNVESGRIISIRQRTAENLRIFISSSELDESRHVDRMLKDLEAAAMKLAETGVKLFRIPLDLTLDFGRAGIRSVENLVPAQPVTPPDFGDLQEENEEPEITEDLFAQMDTVRMREVRASLQDYLDRTTGRVTTASAIAANGVRYGIQEVLCYIRAAADIAPLAENAPAEEVVIDDDRQAGRRLRVRIPMQVLRECPVPGDVPEGAVPGEETVSRVPGDGTVSAVLGEGSLSTAPGERTESVTPDVGTVNTAPGGEAKPAAETPAGTVTEAAVVTQAAAETEIAAVAEGSAEAAATTRTAVETGNKAAVVPGELSGSVDGDTGDGLGSPEDPGSAGDSGDMDPGGFSRIRESDDRDPAGASGVMDEEGRRSAAGAASTGEDR